MIRRSPAFTRSKWFLPLFSVSMGVVLLAASWLGGQPVAGLISLAVMTAFGLVILLGGRSETIRGLRGDGRDERFAQIDLRATAFTGLVLIVALIVAWVIQIAQGHDGNPYGLLLALSGVTYLASVVILRWRG
ncbi:MAG TPA: hypothetical protein VGQ05_00505 [Streptosporangiaceae bacterium]|jgi:hypothetical protein|nr:hypothetical protein [Streptosporangiaceae bacterium]